MVFIEISGQCPRNFNLITDSLKSFRKILEEIQRKIWNNIRKILKIIYRGKFYKIYELLFYETFWEISEVLQKLSLEMSRHFCKPLKMFWRYFEKISRTFLNITKNESRVILLKIQNNFDETLQTFLIILGKFGKNLNFEENLVELMEKLRRNLVEIFRILKRFWEHIF